VRRTVVAFLLATGLLAVWVTPAQGFLPLLTPSNVPPHCQQLMPLAPECRSLSFPPQAIGTSSPPQTINVSILSGGPGVFPPSHFASLVVDSPDFGATHNCPTIPLPRNNRVTCQILVTFHPLGGPRGPRSASLSVNNAAPISVARMSLTGTALASRQLKPCIKKAKKKYAGDSVAKKKAIKRCNKKFG
jgi:hypothetical protein